VRAEHRRLEGLHPLTEEGGHDAGEHVPRAARRHPRVPGLVLVEPLAVRDEGAMALQHDDRAVLLREPDGGGGPVLEHLAGRALEEPRRLPGMRREDARRPGDAEARLGLREAVQPVGVEDERDRRAERDTVREVGGVLLRRDAGTEGDGGHVLREVEGRLDRVAGERPGRRGGQRQGHLAEERGRDERVDRGRHAQRDETGPRPQGGPGGEQGRAGHPRGAREDEHVAEPALVGLRGTVRQGRDLVDLDHLDSPPRRARRRYGACGAPVKETLSGANRGR